MAAKRCLPLSACAVAALAFGCQPGRPYLFPSDPPTPLVPGAVGKSNPPAVDTKPPGVPAGQPPAAPPTTGVTPAAGPPAAGPPTQLPPPAAQTPPGIPLAGMPPPLPARVVNADPHSRTTPTVTGSLLNLGPNETPTDRVVELALRADSLATENRVLAAQIKQLEANATAREQALTEALRDVETASAEVAQTRALLKVLRKELTALKAKLQEAEEYEIETLRSVIDQLKKLTDPPKSGKGEP